MNRNEVEVVPEEKSPAKNGKRGDATKKKVPPMLKIEQTDAIGEKSPAPASVIDLFKRYQKSGEKTAAAGDNMNVGFDQMSVDEKSGFLRKLQMLTVGNKKSPTRADGESSSAGRLLKKFVPSRRSSGGKQEPSSNHRLFSRSNQKKSESEKTSSAVPTGPRKQSARRLNFHSRDEKPAESEAQKNKVVAAMTREYEKIVTLKGVPMAIKSSSSSRSLGCPRGSLETPNESPVKTYASSSPETFHYQSEQYNFHQQPPRDRYLSSADDSPNKQRRTSTRQGAAPQLQREHQSNASWHGELPPRDYTSPTFSRKIFVGGVPWDITEAALKDSFGEFGACSVEWPGQEARYRSGQPSGMIAPNSNLRSHSKYGGQAATGYVYMIFEDERAVGALLHECSQEIGGAGEWYFKIRAQRSKSTEIRQVQIIPWVTSDSLFCEDDSILETGIEPKRTVFVGALHGMMTAQVLHSIMEDCFGSVECVQLDTDKFKYPIGSGRVTFREHGAYFKAIEIGYLHVHTSKFRKRVQIDPFLESTNCMVCNSEPAHCFCRNRNCFKYYCHTCWSVDHDKETDVNVHVPVIVPSSASKSFQGPASRRSHLHSSPSKMSSQRLVPPGATGFPMIVSAPAPTLSALYGYIQNNQHYDPTPITPSSAESTSKRGSRTNFHFNPAVFFNQTPVMSPQKSISEQSPLPGYFANSAAFLTPPPTYYGSPSPQTSSSQYYGAPAPANVFYGYMPQPQPLPYDVAFPQNYQQ